MADLQTQMMDFHEKIRLRGYKNNQGLRDKRDLLLETLRDNINKEEDDTKLFFKDFNQGSYALRTGTKPLHKADDFDIDVGLVFDLDCETHEEYMDDPVALKKRIKQALSHAQRDVKIRRPCVTVQYTKDGENDYHVDLAIYRKSESNPDNLDLAKGKEHSGAEMREWDENDPKGLIDKVNNRFSGDENKEERAQMRRCVRFLKRWRDKKFSAGAPVSIALTCATYHWFTPCIEYIPGQDKRQAHDQSSLLDLVEAILYRENMDWIEIQLPVSPYSDLMDGLTSAQMTVFIEKLNALKDALTESLALSCPHESAKKLEKQFGPEFEVPPKEETAEKACASFGATGGSA